MKETVATFCLVVAASACSPSGPPAAVAPSASTIAIVESPTVASPEARALVEANDRTDADRQLDPGRHPAELITFLGITPGMRIAEFIAGAGYTAELLARAVAPNGTVYAENPKFILVRAAVPWSERLARPANKTIVRVDRELDSPLPTEATNLDLVVINLVYHDTVWLGIDRDKMNRAAFAALKSGGKYAVIDHSARPGTGLNDVQTLHRIDENTVRDEVQRAGFVLQGAGSFLRNPSDGRDWNDSPGAAGVRRGTSDRFALLFVKP